MAAMYRYDPLDRLMSCLSDTQASGQRFYCANKLVTDIQGPASYSLFQYDKNSLAQFRQQGPQRENILLANDPQGSVIQAITETQFNTLTYTLYGYQSDHSGFVSLLGFNGERCESLTGHYLLGNGTRAFNPVLMRFNIPDPMSPFEGGGINAYAYCKNDPINWSDPSGNIPIKKIASLVVKTPIVRPQGNVFTRTRKALLNRQYQHIKEFDYTLAVEAEKRGEFIDRVSVYETPSSTANINNAYELARQTYAFKVAPSAKMAPQYIDGPAGHLPAVDTSAFDAAHIYFKAQHEELLNIPSAQRTTHQANTVNSLKKNISSNKKNRLIYIHKSLNNIRNA
ncbi:RHS repeat-associated core domain-containing protein [Pseudomonas helleri]|uniref:RHS repeat-associated core domain-containing protein n=1 Tax=Pseudomonas helleri TaxID=1608996 RepID=UPI00389A86B7